MVDLLIRKYVRTFTYIHTTYIIKESEIDRRRRRTRAQRFQWELIALETGYGLYEKKRSFPEDIEDDEHLFHPHDQAFQP